jgi:hypothetical protein
MADPKIGVLLPLRIETKFVEPDPESEAEPWRLKVAVIPDEVSMNRHSRQTSRDELDRLEAAWRACRGDMASDDGRRAFRTLAGEVGPARASWLLRTFPLITNEAGEVDWEAEHVIDWQIAETRLRSSEDHALSTIDGLPDQVEIWLGIRDGDAIRLQKLEPPLTIHHEQLMFDKQMKLFGDDPDLWWISQAGLVDILELPFTQKEELDTIECIIAVGLGDSRPAALFQDHRDAGTLSILPLGQPTNTVAGRPAVDLAQDPDTWWNLQKGSTERGTVQTLSFALSGDRETLEPLPGSTGRYRDLNSPLVNTLWHALWGHTMRDIWAIERNMGADFTSNLGLWATGNLIPEGPLPPVRIGAQPYGVLPVTSLREWRSGFPGGVSDQMVPYFRSQRAEWARCAETITRTTVGANTDKLLDILARVPSGSRFAYRRFAPLQALYALAAGLGIINDDPHLLRNMWEERVGSLASNLLPVDPIRRYATYGWPQVIGLALVEPEPLSDEEGDVISRGGSLFFDWLEFLLDLGMDNADIGVAALSAGEEFRQPFPPNSLLLRLLIYSASVAHAELIMIMRDRQGPLLDSFVQNETALWEVLRTPIDNGRLLTFREVLEPQGEVQNFVGTPQYQMCVNWIENVRFLLSRYHEALATGSQAVRVLLSGLERAFRATLESATMRVDPWITGLAWHRLVNLRVRDEPDGLGVYGWVDRPYTGKPGPTRGGIVHAPSEGQLRAAVILRDKAVSDPDSSRWDLQLDSRKVRLAAQLANEVRAGSPIQEVLGRAVEKIIGTPALIKQLRRREELWIRREHAGRRVVDGQKVLARDQAFFAGLGLSETQWTEIEELKTVLNAYADLLVANAVYNVTTGRPERAGEIMDAAAGLGLPPDLDLLHSPRRGRSVSTQVLLALPVVAPPSHLTPGISPTALADPAVAAFIRKRLPAARWTWTTTAGRVALNNLKLTVADTLALSEDSLNRLVEMVSQGSLAPDESLSPGILMHRQAKRLAQLLAGQCLQDHASELRTRYERLYTAATRLRDRLENEQASAIVQARRWGIAPPLEGDGDEAMAAQLKSAFDTLNERIAASPQPGSFNDQTPVQEIARALSELASPGSGFPIYGRMLRSDLDRLLPQYPDSEPEAKRFTRLKANPQMDQTWLEVVAPVRSSLARLESFQLEVGSSRFLAWTNQDDPWELQPLPPEARVERVSQQVIAYAPAGLLNSQPQRNLAVAQLDSWGETVPSEKHATAAAFGFNAPAAHAPQAILLAVSPDESRPLTNETLAQIILETRELAHARMAIPSDIEPYAGIFPFTMLPLRPVTGVSFNLTPPE